MWKSSVGAKNGNNNVVIPSLANGDDDDWDELKPDVTAYGSGIYSAQAATGTSFPGTPRPTADSSYESKDGIARIC